MTQLRYDNLLPGFLLLLLAISGNFLADTFSCQIQETLRTNYLYKHILVFILLYFTIYFAEPEKTNAMDLVFLF